MATKKITDLPRKPAPKKRISGKKSGSPEFRPTESQKAMVVGMVAAGFALPYVAQCIVNPDTNKPISVPTLRKHFAHECDNARDIAKSRVANAAYLMAIGMQHPAMTIFYCKTQLHWKEPAIQIQGDFTLEQLVTGAHKLAREQAAAAG